MRLVAILLLAGCAPEPFDPAAPPETLAGTRLVSWDGTTLSYRDDAFPYELATPLFSDHATKRRAIVLPDGEAAAYAGDGPLDFPVGTLLLKSFLFPADARRPDEDLCLVETRVLARGPDGWEGFPYRWDDDGGDAVYRPGGDVVDVHLLDRAGAPLDFAWIVPEKNQCAKCHEQKDDAGVRVSLPLGPKPHHLHRPGADGVDQLQALADAGLLTGLPALDTVDATTRWDEVLARGVEALSDVETATAARDYLDVNCAHCHNRHGVNGITSQLFLARDEADPFHLGVCKRPGSAGKGGVGRTYDVVPGDPEASILHYRMETLELGAMMPDLGRSTVDPDGVRVVERWIATLDAPGCETP